MLRIGALDVPAGDFVLMAIVNRTPDSFYDRGATFGMASALERVDRVVAEGADMVDVGGVKAAPGEDVDAAEEIRRTVDLVAAIRAAHPALPISIDTWRAEVAREALAAGADVVNDAWGGVDQVARANPQLVDLVRREIAERGPLSARQLEAQHGDGVRPRRDRAEQVGDDQADRDQHAGQRQQEQHLRAAAHPRSRASR